MSLEAVCDLLACPVCGAAFALEDQLRCGAGHAWDVAKQGHVNFAGAPPAHADSAPMVAARERIQATGAFDLMAAVMADAIGTADAVGDAGAGPGRHLKHLVEAREERRGVAMDLSPSACRRAARQHPRIGAVVADVWRPLPVRTAALEALVVSFAPRNWPEFSRVLRPGGVAVVAVPRPDHLAEARGLLGMLDIPAHKADDVLRDAANDFDSVDVIPVERELVLTAELAADLVAMGPSAHHATAAARAVTTGVRVDVVALRRR